MAEDAPVVEEDVPEITEQVRLLLERAIDKSYSDMATLREDRKMLINEYSSDIKNENKTVINKIFQMVTTYQRLLSSSKPNVLVGTQIQGLKPDAENLRLALNHLLDEIKFSKNLNRCVLDGFFGMSVAKTGLGKNTKQDMEIDGEFFDPGQPFTKPVSLRHFVIDTAATELDLIDFMGDRYSCTREYVEETYPEFNKKDIPANGEWGKNKPEDRPSGVKENRDERLRDYIWLWDIYLPKEGLIVTMFDGWGSPPLKVQKYQGPEGGPYDILAFNTVPDEVLGNPGARQVYNLHKMINDLTMKSWQQAKGKKDIVTFEDGAEDDADTIKNAGDGEVVGVRNNAGVQERSIGSIDPQLQALEIKTNQEFNAMSGNLENLAGLGAQTDTVGQEQIITNTTSAMVNNMRKVTVEFSEAIIRKQAWYLFYDPFIDMPLTKRVPGSTQEIYVRYTAEDREGDFLDYNFNIEPYSLKEQSPEEQLAAMFLVLEKWVIPTADQAAESGYALNFEATSKKIADLSGIEFEDLYIPTDPSNQSLRQQQGPIGAPPSKTDSTYTRISRSGTTSKGNDQNLMMALNGAAPQNDGAAELPRGE